MDQNQSSFAAIAGILMISTVKNLWLALDVQERISRILKRIDFFLSGQTEMLSTVDRNLFVYIRQQAKVLPSEIEGPVSLKFSYISPKIHNSLTYL
jgi:hypothetical protein